MVVVPKFALKKNTLDIYIYLFGHIYIYIYMVVFLLDVFL